jgi:hypothetical protein
MDPKVDRWLDRDDGRTSRRGGRDAKRMSTLRMSKSVLVSSEHTISYLGIPVQKTCNYNTYHIVFLLLKIQYGCTVI